jgi:cell division transport system permease protein
MSESYSRFAAWRAQHGAAFISSFSRLARRPFSSLLSLSVMAIALALPLALGWSLLQMEQLSSRVQASRTISVFFQPEVSVATASQLARGFEKDAGVAKFQLKTPEQGLAEFQQSSELAKAVAAIGENPLPVVWLIEPKGDEQALLEKLQAVPDVEYIQHDRQWQQRLQAWLAFGGHVLVLLAVLFVIGAVLAVANNVRLDIATREQEIAVLQQLGASDAYIRRPFLYAGGLLGLCAGILAMSIVLLAGVHIQPSVLDLIGSYGSNFRFSPIPVWIWPSVLALALLLGLLGAWSAVGHHLRQTRPVDL